MCLDKRKILLNNVTLKTSFAAEMFHCESETRN